MPHYDLKVKHEPAENTLSLIANTVPLDILLGGMVQDYAPTPQMMQESNFGSMFSEMEQETNQVQPGIIR